MNVTTLTLRDIRITDGPALGVRMISFEFRGGEGHFISHELPIEFDETAESVAETFSYLADRIRETAAQAARGEYPRATPKECIAGCPTCAAEAKRHWNDEAFIRSQEPRRADAPPEQAEHAALMLKAERWRMWIVNHTPPHFRDHACAECCPGGDSLIKGFRCVPHEAAAPTAPRKA